MPSPAGRPHDYASCGGGSHADVAECDGGALARWMDELQQRRGVLGFPYAVLKK
jgi:hypothetical protein